MLNPIWHGDHVAVYTVRPLVVGEVLDADKFVEVTGRKPVTGEVIRCGFCGVALNNYLRPVTRYSTEP